MITTTKLFSLGFLAAGIFLLAQIILPVISLELLQVSLKYSNSSLISPRIQSGSSVLGVSIKSDQSFSYFVSNLKREVKPAFDDFTISIPNLRIDHAKVMVDSNDATRTLAQLPGTAMPGGKGNLFISGHSALSQFLSIQNSVFAKLPDIKKGDEVHVSAGGINYNYRIIEIKIVDPSDVSVIIPPDEQGRYISLMTCVPPGINLKRLVAIGEII